MFGIGAALLVLLLSTDVNRFYKLARNLEIFSDVYRVVNEDHVEGTDPARLMRIAIDSMLASIDPYTNYISEADMERYRFIDNPTKVGSIGGKLIKHSNGSIVLGELLEGFAAHKAGLRVGDVLLSIDGKSVKTRSLEEIEMFIKGSIGSSIDLEFKRPGASKTMEVSLKLDVTEPKNVPYSGMLDEHTAYVVLTVFTQEASKNIKEALKDLAAKHEVKRVVIDMRDNPGGLLFEAVDIVNIFTPKATEVVTTKAKVADWDKSYKTNYEPWDINIPLVVLVNKKSASASEIVSGSIQDLDRGIIVGQKSYGKGLVQNVYDIGYNSKLKITTAKYYIPSGRCIQAISYDRYGEPKEVADSLKKAFKTRGGRTVFDGGGVVPDVLIPAQPNPAILQALLDKHMVFDFATDYQTKFDSIAGPQQFALTEKDWQDFMQFLKTRNFVYETASQQALNKLQASAQKEGYLSAIQTQINQLKERFETEKQQDLSRYRSIIVRALETEIVSRYYFESGKAQINLRRDPEVIESLKILADPARYAQILSKR